jgi:hypothetical protein
VLPTHFPIEQFKLEDCRFELLGRGGGFQFGWCEFRWSWRWRINLWLLEQAGVLLFLVPILGHDVDNPCVASSSDDVLDGRDRESLVPNVQSSAIVAVSSCSNPRG